MKHISVLITVTLLISCGPYSINHHQYDSYDYDRYNQYEEDKAAVQEALQDQRSGYDSETNKAINEAVERNR